MKQVRLIIHNIRSAHNVGSLLRTAEGLGVEHVYLTGYTPYPITENDSRLPHQAQKIDKQILKTALGTEKYLSWSQHDSINDALEDLHNRKYILVGLEQTSNAVQLPDYKDERPLGLLIGSEVTGIDQDLLMLCDTILEIPMTGEKESFNVAQATAIALYHLTLLV